MAIPATPDHLIDTDFFISHSTADDQIVSQLDAALNAAGITTWVDHEHGIEYGDRWQAAIQDATLRCKAALFILTPDSAKSEWCERELTQVQEHLKRKIYVVKSAAISNWQIPLIVNNTQYKDLSAASFDDPQDLLIRGLIDSLKGKVSFTETISETRSTRRITGAYPFNDLLYTLYGRDSDLLQLTEWLMGNLRDVPIAQVLGIGGVGKTRLAVEVVNTLDFHDGTIWFKFDKRSPEYENSPARLAELIRDHFNLPNMEEKATWQALNRHEILIVLDNAEDCPPTQRYAFAERLCTLREGPRVLLTSRYAWEELALAAHYERDLHAPSAKDGVRILTRMAEVNGYAEKLTNQAEPLAEKSFYHPRLMLYAVGWLKANPPQAIIRALETLQGKEIEKALEEMVGRTLRQMTEQEGLAPLDTLKRLNVTAGGFDRAAADALLIQSNVTDPMLSDLTTLAAWNLLDFDGKRYTIDPLVVRSAGIDESAFIPHYDYYFSLARQHDKAQDYQGLDLESANLEVAFDQALERDPIAAFWFASACSDFLINRMRVRQCIRWLQRIETTQTIKTDSDIQGAFQNLLGNAFLALAGLEDNADNLHRAIAAYKEALRFRTPVAAPLGYAMTQNNLGTAYNALAELEENATNLHRAVAAYMEALRFRTLTAAPLDYALTQNNLGAAYQTLAMVEENTDNLHHAITAYTEALRFFTPITAPLDYAMTQNNLGAAYGDLARTTDSANNLRHAITAYSEALRFRTPIAAPLDYAMTQNNLGAAYCDLAKLENNADNLHHAISAYSEALRFRTPSAAPLDYAMTQFNLGLAFADTGDKTKACAAWHEAEHYYRVGEIIEMANLILEHIHEQGC